MTKSKREACDHPAAARWQGRDCWKCCVCNAQFWGSKLQTPARDIYGVATDAPRDYSERWAQFYAQQG